MSVNTSTLQQKLRWSRVLNLVLGAALAVALIALFAPGQPGGAPSEAAPEVTAPSASSDTPAVEGAGDGAEPSAFQVPAEPTMTIGSPDAPITLIEWTDFTCPYCALFHRETLPAIIDQYVDSGLVRLEIHDVTFIGDQAEDAALAARAAGQQGRYLDYVYALYALSADGARPDLSADTLAGLAQDISLDTETFASDVARADLRAQVQASSAQARQLGISSVPFFVAAADSLIDGSHRVLQGAQPIENFELVLDAALEQASQATQ